MEHGGVADAVASSPASPGLHVWRSHYLNSGSIEKRFFIFWETPCSRFLSRNDLTWQRMLVVSQATLGDECGACVVVVPCLRRISNSVVPKHTSGGVDEGSERGHSVGRVGGTFL